MNLKSILSWLIILAVLSPFIAYAAGNVVPQYGGFIVTSGSMEPEIQTGSLLFTYRISSENIEVGDTITYSDPSGEEFTTHEVIEKNISGDQITFRTQGVANDSPDPGSVSADQVQGKKLFSIPFLGYFITWAGTDAGLILLIFIPGILLILNELRKILEEISSEAPE